MKHFVQVHEGKKWSSNNSDIYIYLYLLLAFLRMSLEQVRTEPHDCCCGYYSYPPSGCLAGQTAPTAGALPPPWLAAGTPLLSSI